MRRQVGWPPAPLLDLDGFVIDGRSFSIAKPFGLPADGESYLFGGFNPSEKYLSVGNISPNIWKNKKCSKPPTRYGSWHTCHTYCRQNISVRCKLRSYTNHAYFPLNISGSRILIWEIIHVSLDLSEDSPKLR